MFTLSSTFIGQVRTRALFQRLKIIGGHGICVLACVCEYLPLASSQVGLVCGGWVSYYLHQSHTRIQGQEVILGISNVPSHV